MHNGIQRKILIIDERVKRSLNPLSLIAGGGSPGWARADPGFRTRLLKSFVRLSATRPMLKIITPSNQLAIEPLEPRRLCAATGSWTDVDIGPVGRTGSAAVGNDGSITLAGSGVDIWNSSDSFNFDYQPFSGDGAMVTHIAAHSNAARSKAGIMLRETTNADSRFVMVVVMQARIATHRTPSFSITVPGKAGAWLQLQRSGSAFTGFDSTDGINWRKIGTVQITMVDNIDAGLCVTSHHNKRLSTAEFQSTTITPTGMSSSIWTDGQAEPLDRWEAETFTWNNKLYAFGGFSDRQLDATSECDVYDPATDQWTVLTEIPTGALTHSSVTVVGNIAYFAGGDLGRFTYGRRKSATSEVLTYNLLTNTWGAITPLPQAVSCGGLAAIDNELFYFGGLTANDKSDRATMWSLDLSNPNAGWFGMTPIPDARNHFGTAVINGIIYAVGGMHRYDEIHGNDAEVDAYNPSTNQWTKMASLPMPWGSNETTTLVANNKIILVGGQTNGGFDGNYLSTIEEYDPTTNQWTNAGNLPEANEGESAAYINGALIVAGGTVDNHGGWAQKQTWLDLSFTPVI
jgi:N-acetylneuraminic acid mutarotase